MKIIFFGTSAFAAEVLKFLLASGREIAAVVTRTDKPRKRSSEPAFPPVKETLLQIAPQLPLFQPEKASTPAFAEQLKAFGADLFVVVAYGEIIKQLLLDLPKKGAINIHASLLPKYRGAAPMQRCLMDGQERTGITIIDMVLQMDAGAILEQAEIAVPPSMTFGELEKALIPLACQTVSHVIDGLEQGSVQRTPQEEAEVTFAPKIASDEEKIDWHREASALHNQIRALSPYPAAFANVKIGNEPIKRLKIKLATFAGGFKGQPGEVLMCGEEGLVVACGTGALRLLEVQLEGKKPLKIEEFIRGLQGALFFPL